MSRGNAEWHCGTRELADLLHLVFGRCRALELEWVGDECVPHIHGENKTAKDGLTQRWVARGWVVLGARQARMTSKGVNALTKRRRRLAEEASHEG